MATYPGEFVDQVRHDRHKEAPFANTTIAVCSRAEQPANTVL
jgi:hypothetical protein